MLDWMLLLLLTSSAHRTHNLMTDLIFCSWPNPVVDGYIWRYAKREGASIFFRGIRSWEKDGHEEQTLQILNTWGPLLLGPLCWPVPTIYLEGHTKYNHVSSTLIRDICKGGKDSTMKDSVNALTELVPAEVVPKVEQLYCSKQS